MQGGRERLTPYQYDDPKDCGAPQSFLSSSIKRKKRKGKQ